MRTILKHFALAVALTALAGCKLAVIVVEGGEVQSIASGTCQPALGGVAGNVCIHHVPDTNYTETFTAVAEPGWTFERWGSGKGFLCEDSTNPSCVLDNTVVAGNPIAEAIISSTATYYLMPIFTSDGVLITDTVTVGGKEWAQPDLFESLSWIEINAVCPAGECSGVLNGLIMNGWTWATIDDLNDLFNHYFGYPAMGPGPDLVTGGINTAWAAAFFDDPWRPTLTEPDMKWALGWMSNPHPVNPAGYHGVIGDADSEERYDYAQTSGSVDWLSASAGKGAWFYRTP